MTYLKALSIIPPWHPRLPYHKKEQSTNYYSEKERSFFPLRLAKASREPVVENAQQDPHCP